MKAKIEEMFNIRNENKTRQNVMSTKFDEFFGKSKLTYLDIILVILLRMSRNRILMSRIFLALEQRKDFWPVAHNCLAEK